MLFGSVQRMMHEFDAKIAEHPSFKNKPVRVIGAGCMGLLSAIMLKEKGYYVKIVAEQLENLTSHKAVGVFFPCSKFAKSEYQKQINKESLQECRAIMNGFHRFLTPETVRIITDYVDRENGYAGFDFLEPVKFVTIDFGNGKTHDVKAYKTLLINVTEMMRQLHTQVQKLGISIEQKKVITFDELTEPIIINCAGLGARELNNDTKMMPVQGHLITLQNQPIEQLDYLVNIKDNATDTLLYFAPKSSGILGCTVIENEGGLDTNAHEFDNILKRAEAFFGLSS